MAKFIYYPVLSNTFIFRMKYNENISVLFHIDILVMESFA